MPEHFMSTPEPRKSNWSRWDVHRQALALTVADPGTDVLEQAVAWLGGNDGLQRVEFLAWHGLAPWWADQLMRSGNFDRVAPTVAAALRDQWRTASALYLTQTHALLEVAAALEQHALPYVVFKGAAAREAVYASPSLRVAGDIDLLVRADARATVAALLTRCGFNERLQARASAHESTFARGRVDIDLHWDILRPGRTRRPLVDSILAERVRGESFTHPCDTDSAFLMLVHPAFAKYVCSANMGLNRVLDFLLFTRGRLIDWPAVARRLDDAGMKTAGWCTLRWMQMVSPSSLTVPAEFMVDIAPGALRRTYLERWLVHDLPGRLLDRTDWLIRTAYTLPLHDRPADAWRAIRARIGRQSHREGEGFRTL